MSLIKKQHYVPQFYLKYFAKNDQIYVFDKFSQKPFPASVRDVASANYFYDLSVKTVNELNELLRTKHAEDNAALPYIDHELVLQQIQDIQIVEKHLSRLEARFAEVMSDVIEHLEKRRSFKHQYRKELALMVAMQYWRTLARLEEMTEFEMTTKKAVMPMVHKMNEIHGYNTQENDLFFKEEDIAIRHKLMLLDENLLLETAQIFDNHIWFIGINETGIPYITSDSPVASYAHKKDDWRSNTGIASPGIEVTMPLSPKYTLIMYEKTYFPTLLARDNQVIFQKKDNVIFYNHLQVYSSHRQLFSKTRNFEPVEEMISETPELKVKQSRWVSPPPFVDE